jgi:hypothetical protein
VDFQVRRHIDAAPAEHIAVRGAAATARAIDQCAAGPGAGSTIT